MKKSTLKKGAAITAAVVILGTSSVFANNSTKASDSNFQGTQEQGKKEPGFHQGPQIDAMGIVTSVNGSIITIKNADNDLVKINVNPETKIIKAPTEEERAAMRAEHGKMRNEKSSEMSDESENHPAPEFMKITDIAIGNWIAISSFGTNTVTLEAANIVVVTE